MATDNGIYPYTPNGPVCIVMVLLFGTSAGYHLFQMIRKKTWFYTPLVVGAIMMTLGYIARYFSTKSPASLGPYIIQSLFIILPPSLYAATIYIIYGRVALFVNALRASLVQPTRVTKIFVVGDVIAFFMQAGGGGMMAQANMADLGQKVMLIGLFVQLAFFGFFLIISLIFWKRTRSSSARHTLRYGKHSWYNLLMLLLAAATFIILRCVFRIIEFGQGHTGYLATHEVFLYMFDAVPMLGVQIMFHVIHAGDVFPPNFIMQKLDDDDNDTTHLQDRV
ncbi:RTA1-domain-containing protein [Hyaloscypha variabilis F]|uniref:RTA1-domain-containing protein n=1 Tax=Hyaloscypha variabilis (strain UAMH 11265 / GT02V1 / F) TaxID=1149755 RepID=A0A2J6RCZ7_HYAVF|nr:RTA1-domain-containing protein [Hyaloscypha variabilis F]